MPGGAQGVPVRIIPLGATGTAGQDRLGCTRLAVFGEAIMKRIEWLFHILAFVLQCNAIVPLLSRTGGDVADLGTANPANTLATAFVLSVVLALMLPRLRTMRAYVPGMWPILALVLLAILSYLWSDYPSVTIRRAGSLTTGTLWAWYVVTRYDLKDVILIIRQALGILALLSFAVGIGSPSLGRGPDGWLGVFSTKNDLGIIMAIGTVTFFYALLTRQPRFLSLLFNVAGMLPCAALLYLSQSRTSWMAALLGAAICGAIRLTYKRVGFAIIIWTAILLLVAPAIVIVTNQLGEIATMLGKDSNLTGRIDLWLLMPDYIAQRPWFGHGFGAFWVLDSTNVFEIWATVGWEPPHAHNGWLDVLLELGIAGMTLAVVQMALITINGIRAVVAGRHPDAQYVFVVTALILIHNLAESSFVRPGVNWVLLVVVTAALAKIAWEQRSEAKPGFAQPFGPATPLTPSQLR